MNKVKAGHKPGSVHSSFFRKRMGNHLSGTNVTASLKRLSTGTRSMAIQCPSPCSWPGFTQPAPLDAAGALLPHLCTLAALVGISPLSIRRCVSVALSSRSPALGITQQAWPIRSPDFPQLNFSALLKFDCDYLPCFQLHHASRHN